MDEFKSFFKKYKKELIIVGAVIIAYKTGYRNGFGDYRYCVTRTFDIMKEKGYNIVKVIPEVVK